MVLSAEGPSSEPSSMPSLPPSSIEDGSQGRRLSNLPAQSVKKSRTLIEEFPDQNITDSPLPEVAGSDSFNSSYGQSTTPSVTGDDPAPAPPSCQELPFTFTYSINYAASAGSNARKVITHFIKARNNKQTDLYSELGDGDGDVEIAIDSSPFVFTTTETIRICSDDSVYKR